MRGSAAKRQGKGLGALRDSIGLFERAAFRAEWFGAPYLIENPVSTISSYWRKPDYTFHPWQYTQLEPADAYTKKTWFAKSVYEANHHE